MQISYERSAKSIRTEQPLDEDGLEDIAVECRGIPFAIRPLPTTKLANHRH